MDLVHQAIDAWRERVEGHPLHEWLVAKDDGIPPERKLWFGVYFINFIMFFRELNLYHISYEGSSRRLITRDPRGTERQRNALTEHANEDMTHSRLFMRDFITLNWDELLGWKPSGVLHWLYSSEINAGLRRRTVAITKLYVEASEPVVKYAVVEAIEACGNALFRHTCELAERYTRETGRELVYWGPFHLARETGHAIEDHGAFDGVVLTPEQRKEAIALATRAFELIYEQNTEMLRLAQETIKQNGFERVTALHAHPSLSVPPAREKAPASVDSFWPKWYDFHFWPVDPHPTQQPMIDALRRCDHEVRKSGILDLFRPDLGDPDEELARLRLILLFTATDTTAGVTFYQSMVAYDHPANEREHALNRLAGRFGRNALRLYVDWDSLELDRVLNWSVSRTLRFIFLDPATETHRDLRAVITQHIDIAADAIQRYWTLVALKKLAGLWSDRVILLAQRVEERIGRPLPYLSRRHTPTAAEPADEVHFETLAIDNGTAQSCVRAIDDILRAMQARNLDLIEAMENQRLRVDKW